MLTLFLTPEDQVNRDSFFDRHTGDKLEVLSSEPLTTWLCTNASLYGAKLEFISDQTEEGSDFIRGYDGIGAFLRYKVDFDAYASIFSSQLGDESLPDRDLYI